MHTPSATPESILSEWTFEQLRGLWTSWALSPQDEEMIQRMIMRNTWTIWGWEQEAGKVAETVDNRVNIDVFLNGLRKQTIPYGIFGTDGRQAGHHIQFTSFWNKKDIWFGLDNSDGIPEWVSNDIDKAFCRYYEGKFEQHNLLTIRVADRRVDHRGWSHTTLFFFLPKAIQKSQIEALCRNPNDIRSIVQHTLRAASAPVQIQGLAQQITQSFLI